MTISRRTFILVSGLVPAAPLLASLPLRSAHAESVLSRQPRQQAAYAADANEIALKIDGWHVGINGPTASEGGEVWITVGTSWRSAWR
jgi:hypothetical protein